jgi:hypothetical protein
LRYRWCCNGAGGDTGGSILDEFSTLHNEVPLVIVMLKRESTLRESAQACTTVLKNLLILGGGFRRQQ